MKDEKNLELKYVVMKLDDIKTYMTKKQQDEFWKLFWNMIGLKEALKRQEKSPVQASSILRMQEGE